AAQGAPPPGAGGAGPPVETSSKPRAARPRATSARPVLSETLSRALGMGTEVRYYLPDAGRAWRRKGKGRMTRPFFLPLATGAGVVSTTRRTVGVVASRKKNDAHHR